MFIKRSRIEESIPHQSKAKAVADMAKFSTALVSVILCVFVMYGGAVNALPSPVAGLSWTFYNSSCPSLETIVWQRMEVYLSADITQAAGLLRLHFHDCFVEVQLSHSIHGRCQIY